MGLENHRCRCGGLINVHVNGVNVHEFVATRYNPTYKNKPDDATHRRVFVLVDNSWRVWAIYTKAAPNNSFALAIAESEGGFWLNITAIDRTRSSLLRGLTFV